MGAVLWIILVLISIILIKYYVRANRIQYFLRNIPAPPGIPLIGHLLYFRDIKAILGNLTVTSQKYCGFFKVHFFGIYTILITDVEKIEKILSSTKVLHKSLEYQHFSRWLGTGLLTSRPEKWRKTRKMLTPTFHFQILERFIDVYNSASDILVERLKDKIHEDKFDIYPYITLSTLDVICETAMGTSVNAQVQSDSKYVKSVQELSRIIRNRLFSVITRFDIFYYLSGDYRKEKAALKIIHDYTTSVIEKRKLEAKTCSQNVNNGKVKMAFLDLLLQCRIDDKPLTNLEIREEVDTFMFEGHDTTASAIAFSIYCLSQNSKAQDTAVEELRDILNHNKQKPISLQDIKQMKYLEMVIKESLRLYPSVPMFGRQLQEDTEFCGEILPKGVTITAFIFGMHRDPTIYTDPEKFVPERFSTDNLKNRNPFAYVPFSAGPRNCIGQKFAMLEMKSTLSNILRNFEILPAHGYKPELVPNVILKSLNGVEVSLRERDF